MEAARVLNELVGIGLTLKVIEGGNLKVEPRAKINDEIRTTIKNNKADLVRLLSSEKEQEVRSIRAEGYGCTCGCRVYRQVTVWETRPLPPDGEWQYEHRPALGWQCEKCSAVYPLIGGSSGPVLVH